MIEQTALNRDLRVIASRKIDMQLFAADGNEFHRVELTVRGTSDLLRDFELFKDRPAGRIDAIPADFFTRKFFAFNDERPQPGFGAKRGAGRARRAAADNGNIDNLHFVAV